MSEILIHEGDFKSIELKISALNRETHVELNNGERIVHIDAKKRKKSKVKPQQLIQLVQVIDGGMVIEVPSNFASKDHTLKLMIDVLNCKDSSHVDVDVRVEKVEHFEQLTYFKEKQDVEHTESTRDTLTLKLLDPNDGAWQSLQRAYQDRQEEINEFFAQVKP